MNIQVIRFDNRWIIADVEKIDNPEIEYGKPDCLLKYPCEIDDSKISAWPPYTSETTIAIRSSEIAMMLDPTNAISKLYLNFIDPEDETKSV